MQGAGQISDQDNARTSSDDAATTASVSFRPDSTDTPAMNQRKASCTDSGFMPWSQDVTDKEESDTHSLTEYQQPAGQETILDQDLYTPVSGATQAPGILEDRYVSYNLAQFQEYEGVISPRGLRPAPVSPTPQNQNFFSPSPSPSEYSSAHALSGFNGVFAPSQTSGQLRSLMSSEGKRHSEDTSPLGIYFRERSQSADRATDPGVPTRFIKVSNVDRNMSIWVARDAFKVTHARLALFLMILMALLFRLANIMSIESLEYVIGLW